MIGKKHGIKISKTNSIAFIAACTSKDLESSKKQYQRLHITPLRVLNNEVVKLESLENYISLKYNDDWHRLLSMPNFVESEFNTNIHWILVDSFQNKKHIHSDFITYLQYVSESGIRDILEKYE
jgi:hypothetical protein